MGIIKTDSIHYENVAAKIREKTNGASTYKPSQMPSGIEEVYEAGMDVALDAAWEGIQQGGTRVNYSNFFRGEWWDETNFRPKYDMRPTGTGATTMFDRFGGQANTSSKSIDLAKIFEDCGVVLDTSQCTGMANLFYYSSVSHVPIISVESYIATVGIFGGCTKLKTIDGFVLRDDGMNTFSGTFGSCYELENIRIFGVIGNDIDFKACHKLTKASIENIMSHLSPTATFTVTLSQEAVNNAYTTDEWQAVIDAKPENVTVSLV